MEKLSPQTLNEIKFRIRQKFQDTFQDNLVNLVLFGSQARGDTKPESNIDILVVLKNKQARYQNRENILDFIESICLEFSVLVSCIYID